MTGVFLFMGNTAPIDPNHHKGLIVADAITSEPKALTSTDVGGDPALNVNVVQTVGGGSGVAAYSDSGGTDKKGLVDADRHVQVDVLTFPDSEVIASLSTDVPLAADGVFGPEYVDISSYEGGVTVIVQTSHNSATNGAALYQSDDASFDFTPVSATIAAGAAIRFIIPPTSKYLKFRYLNGSTPQTSFHVQTIGHHTAPPLVQQPIGAVTTDVNLSGVVQSHLKLHDTSGVGWSAWKNNGAGGAQMTLYDSSGTEIGTLASPIYINALIENGRDETQGSQTDAATLAGAAGTISAKLRRLTADLDAVKTAVETLDNAISGSEMQVDVVGALPAGNNNIGDVDIASIAAGDNNIGNVDLASAIPAGTNLIGQVSASDETSTIYNGTTALTPKFAIIQESSSGDNEVVAAVASKKIRVLSYVLMSNGTVNAKWRSATTDKSGLLYLIANTGASSGYSPVGHFETAAGEALNLNLSAGIAVGGHVCYVEI